MNYLADTHSIDVNPESGEFTFDLDCNVEQGPNGEYSSERVGTRVTLRRVYNSNKMKGTTIGMIVGIVLAVVIAIVVVLVLVFAKATERWCFADDDYQYRDPQEKRRPHTQAQVYRFINSHLLFHILPSFHTCRVKEYQHLAISKLHYIN